MAASVRQFGGNVGTSINALVGVGSSLLEVRRPCVSGLIGRAFGSVVLENDLYYTIDSF